MHSSRIKDWLLAWGLFLFSMLLSWSLMHDYFLQVSPIGDEFALISNSNTDPKEWLFSGYSQYFNVYPEFFLPYTNFIRPTANLLYLLFNFHSGLYGAQLFIVNYGSLSILCAGTYLISRYFGNTKLISIGMAAAAFFAPPFWGSPATTHPSFALDGVAAALCFFGVWLSLGSHWFVAVVFLFVSVFTKETALPIVAATAIYFLIGRKWIQLVSCMAVLSAWAIIRHTAFGSLGGTYSFNNLSPVGAIFRIGSVIPFLPLTYGEPAFFFKNLITSREFNFQIEIFFVLANLAISIILCHQLIRRKDFIKGCTLNILKPSFVATERKQVSSLFCIATVFSGLFFIIIGGGTRFGFVFYAMFLPLVASLSSDQIKHKILLLILPMSFVAFFVNINDLNSKRDMYFFKYETSKELINFLNKHKNPEKPVYVVNDFLSGYSSMKYVAEVARSDLNLFRGSSLEISQCNQAELKAITIDISIASQGKKEIKTSLPSCANFSFEGADPYKMLGQFSNGKLARNQYISYIIPGATITTGKISRRKQFSEFGKNMTVILTNSSLIYYDFLSNKWVYIE